MEFEYNGDGAQLYDFLTPNPEVFILTWQFRLINKF